MGSRHVIFSLPDRPTNGAIMHPKICRDGFHRVPTRSIGRSHGHALLCVGPGKRVQRLRRGTSWRLRYVLKGLCVLQPGLYVRDTRVVTQGNLLTKTLPDTRVALAIIHELHLALTVQALTDRVKHSEEGVTVSVIQEDIGPAITTRGDMVERSGEF